MAKKLCIGLCIAWLATCPVGACWARLGETEAELKERYGELVAPIGNGDAGEKNLCFHKESVFVAAFVFRGRCVLEAYAFAEVFPAPPPGAIKDNIQKAQLLLKENEQGATWVKRPPKNIAGAGTSLFWERSDAEALAFVCENLPEMLAVMDASYMKELEANAKNNDEGLRGFLLGRRRKP